MHPLAIANTGGVMCQDHVNISFRCNRCGAVLEWESDHPKDEPVVCGGCGAANATLGELEVDRKSVVSGKSVSVRVDLGGRRIIKKKHTKQNENRETGSTTL